MEIKGVVESANICKKDGKELWSFQIRDEHGDLLHYDSLTRHLPDPIMTRDYTIVAFIKKDIEQQIQIKIPKREIVASISDKDIFIGKCVTIKNYD